MGEMQRCTSRYVGMCVIILSTRCMSKKGMKQIKPTARRFVLWGEPDADIEIPRAPSSRPCPPTTTVGRPVLRKGRQEGASARPAAGAKWRAGRTGPMRLHRGGREQPGRGTAGCAAMQLRHETAIAFPSARGHASRAAQTPRQAASMRRRRAGAPADPRGKNPSAHVDRRAHSLRNCDRFGQNGPPGPRCCRSSDVLSCTPQPLEPRVEFKSSASDSEGRDKVRRLRRAGRAGARVGSARARHTRVWHSVALSRRPTATAVPAGRTGRQRARRCGGARDPATAGDHQWCAASF